MPKFGKRLVAFPTVMLVLFHQSMTGSKNSVILAERLLFLVNFKCPKTFFWKYLHSNFSNFSDILFPFFFLSNK